MAESLWKRFRGFFEHSVGEHEVAPAAQTVNPIDAVLGSLEASRAKAFELDESAIRDQARKSALEEEKRQMELRRAEMLQDIVALHTKLGTGFSQADLEKMASGLKEHVNLFSNRNTDGLADQGLLSILASVQEDSLKVGWDRLDAELKKAGLEWPRPSGISPSSSADEIAHKSALHLEQQHKDYLTTPLPRLADLMLGVVPAWRSCYPERNGAVWTETVFQAVAGAWSAERHARVVALGLEAAEELRAKVAENLAKELQPVQARLAEGVSSLAEARNLSDQATNITRTVGREIFWAVVGPKLEAARAGQA